MNLLYIHTHDTGRNLTPYGFMAGTEAVQEFARDSLVFRKAFCVSPTCTPSRGAMLTGRYPHCNGLMGLSHRGFVLKDPQTHLASFLKNHGYITALSGVQHEEGFWLPDKTGIQSAGKLGYERILTDFSESPQSAEDYLCWDQKNAQGAMAFLMEQDGIRPFFLSYGLFSTHRPYPEAEEGGRDDSRYVALPYGMEDTVENRKDMAGFLKSAACYDRNFRTVMTALKESGHYEDTIVLVTTDHGLANPFTKCCLNDAGTGVALIMRVPGYLQSYGQVSDALISQLDIFPTLCDLLGFPAPPWLQGKSFAHCFENPQAEARSSMIQEINFHTSYEPVRSVRSMRYRYVRYLDTEWIKYNISNCDESPAKQRLLLHGWSDQKRQEEYLYDLLFDPEEKVNLAGEKHYQGILKELREELIRHMEDTGDECLTKEMYQRRYKVNKKECTYPSIRTEDERE